ncbi:hypothetical protein KK137_14670 [Croceibacterium sp. LX-88]|jgi:hypothetical protein|uniref:Uncharacterized protein n=1 Tax=Croceibacterium selenioxidans TaxID=2838833 RepID=A0ABS5WAT8_9SPHN|nr:hypothetical protein [Croceibacterium selenioxidans]MBT2135579.1 hypothetical protein [Croceibacterium selenioxidans]
MTDRRDAAHKSSAEEAPELHNAEQDDEESQAQTVAREALGADDEESPLDSEKSDDPGEVMDDSTQDLIDRMRDMEQSGRIDMGAYLGEPNMDDEDDALGEGHDPDED